MRLVWGLRETRRVFIATSDKVSGPAYVCPQCWGMNYLQNYRTDLNMPERLCMRLIEPSPFTVTFGF